MLSAELSSREFEDKLKIFASSLGNIFNELLKSVGEEMTEKARSNASSAFNNRTGNLLNSIKFLVNKDLSALTTRKNFNKRGVYYAKMVEYGANINPKKKEYLTFKIDGEWKKVKSVSIRPRPFFAPVREEYMGDNGKLYTSLQTALMSRINEELK